MLELAGLDVSYGGVAAVRGLLARGRPRRDRRADRPERRGQVDDAARDHGPRAAGGGRHPARRPVAARPLAGADRARRHRARARGPAHLRRADGRGEPPPRALGPPRARRRGRRSTRRTTLFPIVAEFRAATPARSPAASSSSSRSRARSSRSPTSCCSTSPRSGSRPRSSTSSSRRSRRSASAASRSCSSSSAPSARWRSPTAPT